MNKIILSDGTSLEFVKAEGLNISFTDETIEELEKIFTKENCSKVQFATEKEDIYGVYNNLECASITKNLEDSTVTVNLKELSTLEVKVEDLQNTVDMVVMSEVM